MNHNGILCTSFVMYNATLKWEREGSTFYIYVVPTILSTIVAPSVFAWCCVSNGLGDCSCHPSFIFIVIIVLLY